MRKINVGCGGNILEGWENIDLNAPNAIKADARFYDYKDVEMVLAGHFLEHLSREDGINWIRKVSSESPSATLIIAIPDIERSCRVCDHVFLQQVASYPFGPYNEEYRARCHSSLWRKRDLDEELLKAGYKTLNEVPTHPLLTGVADFQYAVEAKR